CRNRANLLVKRTETGMNARSKRRPAKQKKSTNREKSTHWRRYLDFACNGLCRFRVGPGSVVGGRGRLLRRRFAARSRNGIGRAQPRACQLGVDPVRDANRRRFGGTRARLRWISVSQRRRGRSVVQYP